MEIQQDRIRGILTIYADPLLRPIDFYIHGFVDPAAGGSAVDGLSGKPYHEKCGSHA